MTNYDKNLILALEEINVKHESGNLFYNTQELLDDVGKYALYEDCGTMREVVEQKLKDEWDFVLPYELEDYFNWNDYIRAFQEGGGEWFETSYGMVERLI